jgi:TonB family protein
MSVADVLLVALRVTLAGSASILLVLLLRHPLRRMFGATVAYGAWVAVPLAIAAAMAPAATLPQTVGALLIVPGSSALAIVQDQLAAASRSGAAVAVGVWFVGMALTALLFVRRQLRFQRSLGELRLQEDGSFVAQVSLGLPAVVGILRPRIVMPTDVAARFDAAQQSLVREHERVHIVRGDQLANLLVVVLRCLFWFNPLLHWAAPRFRQDQELACDARVIALHPHARRDYGEALLNAHLAATIAPLSCQIGFGHPLKERIAMLKHPLPTAARRVTGIALVMALATGIGCVTNSAQTATATPDTPVRIVKWGAFPEYPPDARSQGIGGMVKLAVDIRRDGTIRKVKVVSSSPEGVFDAAATEVARSMEFLPAIKHGRRVASRVVVPVKFDLHSHDGAEKKREPESF